uniref:Uncharacterized protein n=1 Tax=Octopus bimaculoides TaxID=37653 RepID=A0A0L8G6S5_OCTBM
MITLAVAVKLCSFKICCEKTSVIFIVIKQNNAFKYCCQ